MRSFAADFPMKYVCAAWQLRKRGYYIYPENTDALDKSTIHRYKFLPISEHEDRITLNPLYGIVEGRDRIHIENPVDTDVARIFNVQPNVLAIFSASVRGRGATRLPASPPATEIESFAKNLGQFFRDRIYLLKNTYFSISNLYFSSPKYNWDGFTFNEKCSWFDHA